jgi:hypothetical protein
MFDKSYEIMLMSSPEGDRITEYYSTIVPMVNDIITNDQDDDEDEQDYLVIERHFSVRNQRVILLVKNIENE